MKFSIIEENAEMRLERTTTLHLIEDLVKLLDNPNKNKNCRQSSPDYVIHKPDCLLGIVPLNRGGKCTCGSHSLFIKALRIHKSITGTNKHVMERYNVED